MEALRKLWGVVSPYWLVLLLVLLAVAVGVALVWWWRRRRQRGASTLGAPESMRSGRLLRIRGRFLAGLPWLNRAAILDLPTTVVLGPAGSGKTRLIDLDVDWQRQARQFLPSYTQDPLLQIYVGPDTLVQEVSAQLLADDSPQARTALKRLWSKSFSRQNRGLSVITLDVRWLADSPPDEVRRTAQLLRGKLNLISEMCRGPVETRLCLTHMDALEGFTEFAKLLRSYAVPLSFELPQRGDEGRLAFLLEAQEQYLALGLTSLPVDAFEHLQRFYSQGGRSFAALARFVTALLEGGTLSFKPQLSRLYLSSPAPETRAAGVLEVPTEENSTRLLRQRYLRTHLRRCLLIGAACSLPVLAAYGNFYAKLLQTQERMAEFERTMAWLRQQEREPSGSLVQEQVLQAGRAMDELWRAKRYWPPLKDSFPQEWASLRRQLAEGIRQAHLRPVLERCRKEHKTCRPEHAVYLLAVLHASRNEELGKYILSSLRQQSQWSWAEEHSLSSGAPHLPRPRSSDRGSSPGGEPTDSAEPRASWVTAIGLNEQLVRDYIHSSDSPWKTEAPEDLAWARWPIPDELTLEGQLKPWGGHLKALKEAMHARTPDLAQMEALQAERRQLLTQLEQSALFSSMSQVLDRLDASRADVNVNRFKGIESTQRVLEWMRQNREVLETVLRMEEEAFLGFKAVEKMSPAELLTRDGLWIPETGNGPFKVRVLGDEFEFRPPEHSRQLMQGLITYYETTGRMPFRGVLADASASLEGMPGSTAGGPGEGGAQEGAPQEVLAVMDRLQFDTHIKPLVDEFTQRLKNAELSPEAAAQRQEYVRAKMDRFAQGYREGLFLSVRDYRFTATNRTLSAELDTLTQPSSKLVDMLRDVATRANLEPLEGPYYDSLRNALAPFKPLIALMVQDKSGNYAALAPYQALIAQFHAELHAVAKGPPGAPSGKSGKGAKAPEGGESPPEDEADGPAQLTELLSPLGQAALPMLLEAEDSYLRKVNAWLDQQGLIGDLRKPFLQPFEVARDLGKAELESVLAAQWSAAEAHMLGSMLRRYPFDAKAEEEVDPKELEVLHRKDGAFWHFVDRVLSPVCMERGTSWAVRSPLRGRLRLPPRMLSTLSRLSRMSRVLWDEQGKPRPLVLQVLPLPLPEAPEPGSFVTMASLKCGKTAAFSYNQNPSWQDFPLAWWEQQTASIVLELRSPRQEKTRYVPLDWPRSSWSCFRLLEAATVTADQRTWPLTGRGAMASKKVLEISFGVRGEPWAPFREVRR